MKVALLTVLLLGMGGIAPALWAQAASRSDDLQVPAPQEEAKQQGLGSVAGLIKFQGDIPRSATADNAGGRRELLEVDRATRGLRYVVAYLAPLSARTNRHAAAPSQTLPAKRRETVDQQDYAFVPRVAAVREGEEVTFTNSDPANHNVRSRSAVSGNEFNVFTGTAGNYHRRFVPDQQNRPIQLGCDIHPWMRGWIYVFEHPHFAVTDQRGQFRISGVPPGDYTLMLRQPDLGYTHEQKITVSKSKTVNVEVEVRPEDRAKRGE